MNTYYVMQAGRNAERRTMTQGRLENYFLSSPWLKKANIMKFLQQPNQRYSVTQAGRDAERNPGT